MDGIEDAVLLERKSIISELSCETKKCRTNENLRVEIIVDVVNVENDAVVIHVRRFKNHCPGAAHTLGWFLKLQFIDC